MPTETVTIRSKGARQLVAAFLAMPSRAVPLLVSASDEAAQIVAGTIVATRLQGQGPFPVSQKRLGVVTRRLSRSLTVSPARPDGAGGVVSGIGSPVGYFAAHEFGATGTVNVRRHSRRRVAGGQTTARERRKAQGRLKAALSRGGGAFTDVRAHKRKMDTPKREPVATGVRENVGEWRRAVERALRRAAELIAREARDA